MICGHPILRSEPQRFQIQRFDAAAALLPSLPEDAKIKQGDVYLYPGQVVPQRIAEVVLTHEDLLWA